MSETMWIVPEYNEALVENLADGLGISKTAAGILINRGITTVKDARAFLHPSLDQLHDPMLLPDMEAGVERTARALESGEKILVHGDYDVDGVTSTAVLIRTLTRLGGNVIHRIPHRKRDGYDIKPFTADEAKAEGVTLIITADCGVTACQTIERATELGVDIVVTDHHEPGEDLPRAVAVINPMRKDSTYPFPCLAGVGVALKFAQALVRRLGLDDRKYIQHYLDLAAFGTIADVMPLVDENRVIAKFGLEALANTKKIGLQAMIAKVGLAGRKITTHSVGYVLGPRINAVGRLDDATIALQLLLTSDRQEADELVEVLEQRNQERQAEQARILQEVQYLLESKDLDESRALVLYGKNWNSGVVGIVASKVVEQYRRPAILLSMDEEEDLAHGSARSIEAFNMISALNQCRELLDRAGGHALAAGLSLKIDNLQEFERKLNQVASEIIQPDDLVPKVLVDGQINPENVSWDLVNEIKLFEPFGQGNPEPVFTSADIEVVQARRCGSDGSHLKLRLKGRSGHLLDGIGFGLGYLEPTLQLGRKADLCYNIKSNNFNGYDNVQLTVKDIKSE